MMTREHVTDGTACWCNPIREDHSMSLSDELKQWGYHAGISPEGKQQHLEMAARATQLEEQKDDLLNKLVAGEELYISRGMRIARLKAENEHIARFASFFYGALHSDNWPDGAYQCYQTMPVECAGKIDALADGRK